MIGRFKFFRNTALFTFVIFMAGGIFVESSRAMTRQFQMERPQDFGQMTIYVSAPAGEKIGIGAQNFIQSMADRGIDFLSDTDMGTKKRKAAFRRLLQDSFDMKTIGRFSLGRYWRVSTPEQRKEYQALFETMLLNVYTQRFSGYEGQKFAARDFHSDGLKDTIVTSFIIPEEGPEIQVEWRVRYKKGRYKVVDVIVEGVSMSVTQRSDFSSVIQRGGGNVQVLLDHLSPK